MCSISGFSLAPGSDFPVKAWSHQSLLFGEVRGKDASGWAYYDKATGKVMYFKEPVKGGNLRVKQLPDDADTALLHTRNMTIGPVKFAENNHPLVSKSRTIVLIHNGVVDNHDRMRKHYPDLAEVDSSVIPELIYEFGVAGLSQLNKQSWAALAWFDSATPGVLHLAKTQGAPLILVGLDDGSLLFGSTFEQIYGALKRVHWGTRIEYAYAMDDLNYMRVKAGRITYMENLEEWTYLRQHEDFKTAVTYTPYVSETERARLKAITEGKASATTPTANKPDAPNNTPVSNPTVSTAKTTAPASTPATGEVKKPPGSPYSGVSSPATGGWTGQTYRPAPTRDPNGPNAFTDPDADAKIMALFASHPDPQPLPPKTTPVTTNRKGKGPTTKRGTVTNLPLVRTQRQVGEVWGSDVDWGDDDSRWDKDVPLFLTPKYSPSEVRRLHLYISDMDGRIDSDYTEYETWVDDIHFGIEVNMVEDWGTIDARGNHISTKMLWDEPAEEEKLFTYLLAEDDDWVEVEEGQWMQKGEMKK